MKTMAVIALCAVLGACAARPVVPVVRNVYVYQPIPKALLQACPGADWSKVKTWRDIAVAAEVEKSARAVCALEIQKIGSLQVPPPQ